MNDPMKLLYVLLGVIPVLVAGAGAAAFLLLRAGYGPLVWGVLPFVVMLLLAGSIGALIGRSATTRGGQRGERPPRESRKNDGKD